MSVFFWSHLIAWLILLIVCIIIAISNLFALKSLKEPSKQTGSPSISVLIPARNEEDNIERCISSLLAQTYSNYEIIVLDDRSTDKTGEILSKLAANTDLLRILQGTPLPDEWTGKNWACHQLAQAAESELILFVDADTIHNPNMLKSAISALINEDADLLTAIPKQLFGSWSEKLIIPILNWSAFAIIPFAIAHRVKTPKLVLAIGQFMLFKRHAYFQIGGHQSIKSEILDDIPLARNIKASGLRWRLYIGKEQSSCRMYHNFKEVYHGLSRSFFTFFGKRTFFYLWAWMSLGWTFLEPLIIICMHIFGVPINNLTLNASIVMIFLSLLLWGIVYTRFNYPIYLILLYPIIISICIVIAIRSLYISKTGRLNWKGRKVKLS